MKQEQILSLKERENGCEEIKGCKDRSDLI